jgi:hypothetical protein
MGMEWLRNEVDGAQYPSQTHAEKADNPAKTFA